MIAAIPAFIVAAAAAAATTHEGKSGGLPQLNPADFAPQLIWLAITFTVLYFILARVALPRIGEVIEERRDRVQRDLDSAERFKKETDAALAAYERALAEARAKASSMAKNMREKLACRDRQGALKRRGAPLGQARRGGSTHRRHQDQGLGERRRDRGGDRERGRQQAARRGREPRRGQEGAPARRRVRFFMLFDPSDPVFWVMIAFFAFMALLIYYKVPGMVGKSLDARADAIRHELDEARRLRDEAQSLLNDYQRKSRQAEEEAKSILEQAKRESEALAAETRKSLTESVERRTRLAEDKIARAEAQALAEVRASAVDSAITAAEKILKSRTTGKTASALIETSIRDLEGKLN